MVTPPSWLGVIVTFCAFNVIGGIERVDDVMQTRSVGHQLHEPHGALFRTGGGIEIRLDSDYSAHEIRI